jgi:hypothetical protein
MKRGIIAGTGIAAMTAAILGMGLEMPLARPVPAPKRAKAKRWKPPQGPRCRSGWRKRKD